MDQFSIDWILGDVILVTFINDVRICLTFPFCFNPIIILFQFVIHLILLIDSWVTVSIICSSVMHVAIICLRIHIICLVSCVSLQLSTIAILALDSMSIIVRKGQSLIFICPLLSHCVITCPFWQMNSVILVYVYRVWGDVVLGLINILKISSILQPTHVFGFVIISVLIIRNDFADCIVIVLICYNVPTCLHLHSI